MNGLTNGLKLSARTMRLSTVLCLLCTGFAVSASSQQLPQQPSLALVAAAPPPSAPQQSTALGQPAQLLQAPADSLDAAAATPLTANSSSSIAQHVNGPLQVLPALTNSNSILPGASLGNASAAGVVHNAVVPISIPLAAHVSGVAVSPLASTGAATAPVQTATAAAAAAAASVPVATTGGASNTSSSTSSPLLPAARTGALPGATAAAAAAATPAAATAMPSVSNVPLAANSSQPAQSSIKPGIVPAAASTAAIHPAAVPTAAAPAATITAAMHEAAMPAAVVPPLVVTPAAAPAAAAPLAAAAPAAAAAAVPVGATVPVSLSSKPSAGAVLSIALSSTVLPAATPAVPAPLPANSALPEAGTSHSSTSQGGATGSTLSVPGAGTHSAAAMTHVSPQNALQIASPPPKPTDTAASTGPIIVPTGNQAAATAVQYAPAGTAGSATLSGDVPVADAQPPATATATAVQYSPSSPTGAAAGRATAASVEAPSGAADANAAAAAAGAGASGREAGAPAAAAAASAAEAISAGVKDAAAGSAAPQAAACGRRRVAWNDGCGPHHSGMHDSFNQNEAGPGDDGQDAGHNDGAADGAVQVTILHFNDWHVRVEGTKESYCALCTSYDKDQGRCSGGLARMATFVKQQRRLDPDLLLLNAGDDFIGTEWDRKAGIEAPAAFMNLLKPDAMTIGNHEWDKGLGTLKQYLDKLNNNAVLGANIDFKGHELKDKVRPYVVKKVKGKRVCIFGLTTQYALPGSSQMGAVYIKEPYGVGRLVIKSMQDNEGCHATILLSHLGYTSDLIAAQVLSGVDIIVGGHSHSFLWPDPANPPVYYKTDSGEYKHDSTWGPYPTYVHSGGRDVPVVQASWGSRYMGRLQLSFEPDDKGGKLSGVDAKVFMLGGPKSEQQVEEDEETLQEIKKWRYW